MSLFEFWNSRYDWFSELCCWLSPRKIQIQLSLVFIMLDITEIYFCTLGCRWQLEAEAEGEVVEGVLMPQSLWRNLSQNRPNYKSSSVETIVKQSSFQT